MKKVIAAAAALGLFSAGVATATAPEANAQPCGGAVVWGNGGSQCDGPFYADGSFQRCVSVYVLGIGGWNCYIVPPPIS